VSRIGTATGTAAEVRRPAHANRRASADQETRLGDSFYGNVRRESSNAESDTAVVSRGDPWAATISRLGKPANRETPTTIASERCDHSQGPSAARVARRNAAIERAQGQAVGGQNSAAVITFVERFGAKSISITWRDSTAGRYTEQLWVRRIARSRGVCALTGANIVRGDAVYGPFSRPAMRPRNVSQMILAELLDDLE
jgi:hypothetical protein